MPFWSKPKCSSSKKLPSLKLLLDECIDRRFARELKNHNVRTALQMGWTGIRNGDLLKLAEDKFDVFITVDRNLSFQQHLPRFNIAVVVLHAKTNRIDELKPLVPKLLSTLSTVEPGKLTRVGN